MSEIRKKCLNLLPIAIVSRAVGSASEIHFPRVVQAKLNKAFAKVARLDMNEAEQSITEYASINALFTRSLKRGARTVSNNSVVSPVDGKLTAFGHVTEETVLAVKNQHFDVDSLVGTTSMHDWLLGSYYFIIYLSPTNYHRIHAPIAGKVTHMSYVPGRLLPVNRLGLFMTDELFPTNERLTSFIEGDDGHCAAVVKVGATCVGKITVTYDDCVTNKSVTRHPLYKAIESQHYEKGEELGTFNLGSTVILFVESKDFKPSPTLTVDMEVKMGQGLGDFKS